MIFATSLDALYIKHKDEIEKIRLKHIVKPLTHADLELTDYTDKAGRRFYRYPKSFNMSIERMGKLKYFTQYLSKGLTAEEDDLIDKEISAALNQVGDPKAMAIPRIGALLMERQKRKELCFHTLIFYNILAVQWIREDEDPSNFDEAIQFEKVQDFIKAPKEVAISFFLQPELNGLLKLLKITSDDVPEYLAESERQIKILAEKLTLINNYRSTSKSTSPTSEKS